VSTLAPTSIRTTLPFAPGNILAKAGLSNPLIFPRTRIAAPTVDPLFPALTTASALPFFYKIKSNHNRGILLFAKNLKS